MNLLPPLLLAEGQTAVRVILIESLRRLPPAPLLPTPESVYPAIAQLGKVCDAQIAVVMICDSAADSHEPRSLKAAEPFIRQGAVDLVVAEDLSRLSRDADKAFAFLAFCKKHGTRFLSFLECFDTAFCEEGGAA